MKNRKVIVPAVMFAAGFAFALLSSGRSNDKKNDATNPVSADYSILPAPATTPLEKSYQLEPQETIILSEEQFAQLIELQDNWFHAIGWMSETVKVDLESLGISDEHNDEVETVLTELRDAFRREDVQRLESSDTGDSITISVPAYPEVGRQLVKGMIATLSEVVGSDKAKVLIPVVKRAMATPTSNFGEESKKFVITPRDDGRVHIEVFLDGVPNGSLLAYGEMPLKWKYLTSFAYPEDTVEE